MRFNDHIIIKNHRYSIGTDQQTGELYISFPVSNGLVDYEEYYRLDAILMAALEQQLRPITSFVEECRKHDHDDKLIVEPGSLRGSPS